jgi:hypothetical protein
MTRNESMIERLLVSGKTCRFQECRQYLRHRRIRNSGQHCASTAAVCHNRDWSRRPAMCQLSASRSATAITPHRHADRVCVRPARMVYTSGPRGEGTGLARRITLQSSELERSRSETAPALARRSGTWRNIIHKKPFAKYGQTKSPSPAFPTRAARGIVNGHSEPSIGPQPDGDARVWHSQSLPSSDTNPATSDMRGTWTHRAMTKDDNYEQAFR